MIFDGHIEITTLDMIFVISIILLILFGFFCLYKGIFNYCSVNIHENTSHNLSMSGELQRRGNEENRINLNQENLHSDENNDLLSDTHNIIK